MKFPKTYNDGLPMSVTIASKVTSDELRSIVNHIQRRMIDNIKFKYLISLFNLIVGRIGSARSWVNASDSLLTSKYRLIYPRISINFPKKRRT